MFRGLWVMVTRPSHQAEGLCKLIESEGGQTIRWPVIAIEQAGDRRKTQRLVDKLATFDGVMFVSANAVQHGMDVIASREQTLEGLQVFAVGHATAKALKKRGVAGIRYPEEDLSSEGLIAMPELQAAAVRGRRFLVFRGEGGRELLADTLRERGAQVEYAEVYRRIRPASDPAIVKAHWDRGMLDIIIVTSCDGLQNLFDMIGDGNRSHLRATPLLTVSDRVAELARKLGWKGSVSIAANPGDGAIVEALSRWWHGEG